MNNSNNQYNSAESSIRTVEMNKTDSAKNIKTDFPIRGSMFTNKVILPPLTQHIASQHIAQPHSGTYRYPQQGTPEPSLWMNKPRPAEPNNAFTPYSSGMDDSLAAARLVVNFSNTPQQHGFHNTTPTSSASISRQSVVSESPLEESIETKETKETSQDKLVKKTKPKKKERCMVCFEMFSNLKTHSALHMDVEKRPFKCLFCSRGFARNNDLQRHQRKHLLEKNLVEANTVTKKKNSKNVCATDLGFKCPFYENKEDIQPFGNEEGIDEDDYVPKRCHSTGIFTRCDTFKNHLKALHFRYPKGTVRKNRANVSGFCKHCSMQFENCKEWADEHVLKGKCNNNRPFKNYMLVKTIPVGGIDKTEHVLHVEHSNEKQAVPTSASVLDLNNLQ